MLRAAAEIRAATGAKTPDALQIAGALREGCTALISNDRRLPTIAGLPIVMLEDFAVREAGSS